MFLRRGLTELELFFIKMITRTIDQFYVERNRLEFSVNVKEFFLKIV